MSNWWRSQSGTRKTLHLWWSPGLFLDVVPARSQVGSTPPAPGLGLSSSSSWSATTRPVSRRPPSVGATAWARERCCHYLRSAASPCVARACQMISSPKRRGCIYRRAGASDRSVPTSAVPLTPFDWDYYYAPASCCESRGSGDLQLKLTDAERTLRLNLVRRLLLALLVGRPNVNRALVIS